jgi:hypothetical protein
LAGKVNILVGALGVAAVVEVLVDVLLGAASSAVVLLQAEIETRPASVIAARRSRGMARTVRLLPGVSVRSRHNGTVTTRTSTI